MSKKSKKPEAEVTMHKCVSCKKEFEGTGKRGHPFSRCPKCRKEE